MQVCDGCKNLAIDLFSMPDDQRLCTYCSNDWVMAANHVAAATKAREYNNTKHFLREEFGTITAWAKACKISPATVTQVLNTTRKADAGEFSTTQIKVLNLLIYSGLGDHLVTDGYINNKWLAEARRYITEV